MSTEENVLHLLSLLRTDTVASAVTKISELSERCQKVTDKLVLYPLNSLDDRTSGKRFIASCFNCLEDNTYRSPWTSTKVNQFGDSAEIAEARPSDIARLELTLNDLYASFCTQHFDHPSDLTTSVYLWPADDSNSFNGCLMCSKRSDSDGAWDIAHIVKVSVEESRCELSVYSSVWCNVEFGVKLGRAKFEITKEKVTEKKSIRFDSKKDEVLVRLIGETVEEHELLLRRQIEQLYFERCVENLQEKSSNKRVHAIFAMNGIQVPHSLL